MTTDGIVVTAGIATAAYIAQQLFGKTLAEMGNDLNNMYKANRDKLLSRAAMKVKNPNDGAIPNLRVARDVIWNGAVTDDEVCAEYFGGILASSRSSDGKDDSALIYVDCIKALSAKQLHLHFIIYSSLEALLFQKGQQIRPGVENEIVGAEVWFASNHLIALGLRPPIDLNVLHRQGLISAYATDQRIEGDKALLYAKAQPTTFGVLMYAVVHNCLNDWHLFSRSKFDSPTNIAMPPIFASSLEQLSEMTGLVTPGSPQHPN